MTRVAKKKGSNRAKTRFFVLCAVFLGLVSLSVGVIFKDWLTIIQNKQEIQKSLLYYSDLLEEEQDYNSEITKLHDDEYQARYAREKYLYSLPGEFIIKIPKG